MQTKRDYYEVLGVARDADEATLKRAFRTLARELHPDVSEDLDAEDKFREVAEAYEVLSDAETRQRYDRFGHDGLSRSGYRSGAGSADDLGSFVSSFFGSDLFGDLFGGSAGQRRGSDVLVDTEITLAEAAVGAVRNVSYTAAAVCERCTGNGAEPGSDPAVCSTCGGLGQVQTVGQSLLGRVVRQQVCMDCSGAGKIVTDKCKECRGYGRVEQRSELAVDVPAGIQDGQRIRISGRGHVGDGGQRPGDLFVRVGVAEDASFVRQGDDLVTRLDISMVEAALGGAVTVPTLDGELELELEPGTQPGTVKELRGLGMPALRGNGRGSQHVVVNVRVPRRLDDEGRRLLAEFDKRTDASSYDEDEGFFDRLRGAFR
jgi:molecular chaperone DnaJ